MNEAKIRLSGAEMELAKNADLILTKNRILEKVRLMLGSLVEVQKEILYESKTACIPEEVQQSSYKISRGENYLGLPWVVLDHPRYFSRENVMAFRTLFWWGRSFSVTLHLSGSYKRMFEKAILSHYNRLSSNNAKDTEDVYCCVNPDQWEHHFESSNYRLLKDLSQQEWQDSILERSFIKLAKRIPLEHWNETSPVVDLLASHYLSLVEMLVDDDQLPRR